MTFHIVVNGKPVGPFDEAGLRTHVKAGDLGPDSFVWRPGMKEWLRAREVPELRELLSEPKQKPKPQPKPENREVDPFDVVSERSGNMASAPYGDETRFFIAQAGVNRRNPVWKVALFVLSLLLVPVAILWFLSALKVVPLEVTRVDENGNEVKRSVFSKEGVSGLGQLLLGNGPDKEKTPTTQPRPITSGPKRGSDSAQALRGASSQFKDPLGQDRAKTQANHPDLSGVPSSPGSLQAHYEDIRKQDIQPRLRARSTGSSASNGPSPEDIQKVVSRSQPALQLCIDAELRKNPAFRGGRVNLVATIAGSGVVTQTLLDRKDLDRSELGKCLKNRARRMVFAAFGGAPVDLEIPLILGRTF